MESNQSEDMDAVLSSMCLEEMNEAGMQFNVERPGADQDMLEEVNIIQEPNIVDFQRLMELTNYSDKGNSQLAMLVKNWEYNQAKAVHLLREELDELSKQQREVELKKVEILEEHRFEKDGYDGDEHPISILDAPKRRKDVASEDEIVTIDAEDDSVLYWKQKALRLEKLLEESLQREQILVEKLHESINNLERQSCPVEELSQVLNRADNFLHFVLQNAPVVIGHQDEELRYRFMFNHFPSLKEQDIIGKTDVEIFSGAGVKDSQDFKREVLERGLPAKREITFETELFGSKTFLMYVEPVFSKAGETIGVNYMGMEVTDQVRKREKMAKLREEIAVQKAKETELNKTIHITEETMCAKQMLATMSQEIRSPLSGVVRMTEILSTTNLDKEQRQLVEVMLSSGNSVLQLINDILDLSKVESGVSTAKQEQEQERDRSDANARINSNGGTSETCTISECSSTKITEVVEDEIEHKILLVEDNKINIMVTTSMMKELGYTIDVVFNGAEAVRAVQCNTYHLILMDVCMPVMDGFQATRLIRSFEEKGSWEDAVKAGVELSPHQSSSISQLKKTGKRIPIIGMTANALSESADECYANGMDSFVSKPITQQSLKECLQTYLKMQL